MENILHTLLVRLDACTWPQIEELAQATGVPFHTISKIKRRETTDPRISTVQALMAHLGKTARKRKDAPTTTPA